MDKLKKWGPVKELPPIKGAKLGEPVDHWKLVHPDLLKLLDDNKHLLEKEKV